MATTMLRVYEAMRRRIVPRLRHAQDLYVESLDRLVLPGVDWLDLGCGHHLLPLWYEREERALIARCRSVVGIDADYPSLRRHRSVTALVHGHIGTLPFAAESFDLVSANMVVEHLDDPVAQFREVARVLRPGGALIFHTPNARGYPTRLARLAPGPLRNLAVRLLDGRASDDVFITHYRANTLEDVRRTAAAAGLSVASVRLVASQAMFQVIPPLAAVELVVLRALLSPRLRGHRSNVIAVLRKAVAPKPSAARGAPAMSAAGR